MLATVSYQLNYSPLKIHLFSRTDVAFFLLLLTYFLFMFNMEILKEHRTDSNHRRTGITLHHLPLKVLCSLYVLSAMCVTTYLKAMLTDGFLLSVSSRAANYAPHKTIMLHGELSATSPAHHRMAINHLLQRFCMMPFLGLVATHRGESMITTQRVVDALICLFIKGFPCT